MFGIDLDSQIEYKGSSLRFFNKGEHHISRVYEYDVLLMVYEGVLRFSEDGTEYEIGPGQYHIQKRYTVQEGKYSSDAPKYLFIHFVANWKENGAVLPKSGYFSYKSFAGLIEKMDLLSHGNAPYTALAANLFEILYKLYRPTAQNPLAKRIADYIEENHSRDISLETLCNEFHFCKNHIINVFKKSFSQTPVEYINSIRIKHAQYLMEVTSDSIESISLACGFKNYSHFYKLFIRKNNISPEKWRERKRLGY